MKLTDVEKKLVERASHILNKDKTIICVGKKEANAASSLVSKGLATEICKDYTSGGMIIKIISK